MKFFSLKHRNNATLRNPFFHKLMRNPYTDWACMVGLAFGLIIIFTVIGVLVFMRTHMALSHESNATVSQKKLFDAKALQAVLDAYHDKESDSTTVMKGYIPPDPSI